jgi:hypothetical protein
MKQLFKFAVALVVIDCFFFITSSTDRMFAGIGLAVLLSLFVYFLSVLLILSKVNIDERHPMFVILLSIPAFLYLLIFIIRIVLIVLSFSD